MEEVRQYKGEREGSGRLRERERWRERAEGRAHAGGPMTQQGFHGQEGRKEGRNEGRKAKRFLVYA